MLPRYYEKYSLNQALFYNLITYSFFLKTFGNHSLIIDLFKKNGKSFYQMYPRLHFCLTTYIFLLVGYSIFR